MSSCKNEVATRKRLTEEEQEKMVKLWNRGVAVKKIAKKFGVKESYVYGYARRHTDVCKKRVRGRKSPMNYAKIEKMWKEGFTAEQIAKEFNTTKHAINGYVTRHRDVCPKRPVKKPSVISHEDFVDLWNAGLSGEEIANLLGTTRENVYIYAVRHREECPPRKIRSKKDV